MEAVLDFWGVDCTFGRHFECSNRLNLRSEEDKCLALVFSKYQVSKATTVQVSHRVLIVFSKYKLTFVKMIALGYE